MLPHGKGQRTKSTKNNTISKEKFASYVAHHPRIRKIIEVLNQEARERRTRVQVLKRKLKRSGKSWRFDDRSEKESIDSEGNISTLQRSLTIESDKLSSRMGSYERSKSQIRGLKNPKFRSHSLMKRNTTLFNRREVLKLAKLRAQQKVIDESRKIQREMLTKEVTKDLADWKKVKD